MTSSNTGAGKRGGFRPNSGRKTGSGNKKTAEIALNAARRGITPLEYMLKIMRKPIPPGVNAQTRAQMEANRMDAAKAAAPYVHPRLQAITMSGEDGGDIPIKITVKYVGSNGKTN